MNKQKSSKKSAPIYIIDDDTKCSILSKAYLGKKGYTLPKSVIPTQEMDFIKKALTLKPFIPGQSFGAPQQTLSFPVYRENDNKIYIPRFYGIERYGTPERSDIEEGLNIDVPFVKSLRDYQEVIVQKYIDHVSSGAGGGILEVPCGRGKCLGINTPILMYDGTIKMVQDIVIGDKIMGDDSKPRNVLSLARGREKMYKVCGKKGDGYVVNESHILSLKHESTHEILDICVMDYLKMDISMRTAYMGYRANIKSKNCNVDVDTTQMIYEIDIQQMEEDDYYGFEIDGNRRFVLGDFTVTHNTVIALKTISILKKKTLILVHKEFLMNQWIERMEEFIPSARIGKIQAQVCDTENKDVVIGMIQTMYSKSFPQEIYSQFGLTVIDEVHRIGSEEFSKTLLKTITPYMLGISATVERKDKLTDLLYMFIGPKIYSETRANDDPVCVRGIEFKTQDTEFNEVELDFRGNTKYSTMISKLCDFGPRSDFIVRVVKDLLEENPDGQIMILAHNKSLLKYLHDAIRDRNIATAGYYVGGMKQKDLQETETKQVVIATYAMAAEALDIKTLSRLVMATPKTDITQSVGRILRIKHENPVIVDIVDSHDCFQNQWRQRKRYYKKCDYRIRSTTSTKYVDMKLDWNHDDSWLWVFEPGQGQKKNDEVPAVQCAFAF